MRILWLALSVLVIALAIGAAVRSDNPNARIGLGCVVAAGAIFFLSLVF
ncbi:MAG: hypothetical protein U5R31_01025 [Acidimicrobiia bacterium]|nr:hypothetical protein [Acidimicrobiia bacterium]